MNKTIVCVGCSWTYGYGLESRDTYSAILQDHLKNYRVINAGHCGSDINYAIFSAVRLINEFNPDLVIFQITSFDRVTLGTDGFENFLENSFAVRSDDIYYEDNKEYVRLLGIGDNIKTKFTKGSFAVTDQNSQLSHLLESTIRGKLSEYKAFVKILFENIIYSDYQTNQNWLSLFLFQKYLENIKIKGLFFQYSYPAQLSMNKNILIKHVINNENFIKLSFMEWLDKNYPSENFFIDNGYHLSRKGNELFIKEYLMPYLEKIL